MLIGTEYVLIDNAARADSLAEMLAPVGLAVAKPLPEQIAWDKMQPTRAAAIDFAQLDNFVSAFQGAGFSELILALKSNSAWASRAYGPLVHPDPAPKPEFVDDYEAWISAVVERYDGDGDDDMPGLGRPVRYYEIGSEFSSYEPEPVDEYLAMLERAYSAAHRSFAGAIVTHAAFLTTLAFASRPEPEQYETAFEAVPDTTHGLADIRRVLDRPDLFDVLNVHALGDPYEIEDITAWLRYEMAQRSYAKPIIVSDTATTPFIAWGPASVCDRDPRQMGRVVPPAVEADRCRLAAYFSSLLADDDATVRWVQSFAARDLVYKVVVAADQDIQLLNTAFTEDLLLLKLPFAQAGAGNSPWAGLVDVARQERRAAYYALQQLAGHLADYDAITRVAYDDEGVRVYQVSQNEQRSWIAWYDPGDLVLPGDAVPQTEIRLDVSLPTITTEELITQAEQTQPVVSVLQTDDGIAKLVLTSAPLFITPDQGR